MVEPLPPSLIEYEPSNWFVAPRSVPSEPSLLKDFRSIDFYREYEEDSTTMNEYGQPLLKKLPNEFMKNYLTNIVDLNKKKEKFSDPGFPPELTSLKGDGSKCPKDWISGPRTCTAWKRPTEFFGEGNFAVFKDKIEPADIKQGAIGNCYFMASVAALSENPHRIYRLFISRDVSPYGCYCLNVCDGGRWKSIIIDDKVPCYDHDGSPAFAKGNGNEIWVMLLEKVWAKLYKGYCNIEGGWAREVLNELTGAPCTSYSPDYIHLFEKIEEATQNKWVMTTASATGSGSHDQKTETGISHNHLYSLLGGYRINHFGKEVLVVKLRNPWGHGEWKGEWSDSWNGWPPGAREQMQLTSKEDGVFCMPFSGFVKEFRKVEICRYYDDFKFTCLKTKSPHNKIKLFEINIEKEGSYYFIICQKNQRKFDLNSGYTYSGASLRVGYVENGKIFFAKTENNPSKEKHIDTWIYAEKLEKRKYIVGIRVSWYNMKESDYVFKVYGEDNVEIVNLDQAKYPFFLV